MKDFKSRKDQSFPDSDHSEDEKNLENISPLALFDAASMDRFELLSAYLDGEVTALERRQVQQWLDTDPQVQKWYRQLTKLQQSAKYFPIPVDQTTHQLSARVFRKLDRRRNQHLCVVGGALVTAIAVGLVIHLFPGRYSTTHQMAQNLPSVSEVESEPLMIALNRPLFDMSSLDGEFQNEK